MLRLDGVEIVYPDWRMTADLALPAGSSTALIGPSGAGKSTLLNAIAGFQELGAGRILWRDRDIGGLAPAERPVTLLFQEHNLFAHLTVAQNVGLGLRPDLRLDRDGQARVAAALAEVGLEGLGPRRPAQLSGGQRQRVALARALLRARPLLLLDEPFAALGPALARRDARPGGPHPRRAGRDADPRHPSARGRDPHRRADGAGGRQPGASARADRGALRRPTAGTRRLSGALSPLPYG